MIMKIMKVRAVLLAVCFSIVLGLGSSPSLQPPPLTPPPQELMYPLTVCPEGPPACDFATIGEALEAAIPKALILIAPGTYRESLTITKSVRLIATERGQVRLEVPQEGYLLLLLQVEGELEVLLEGITLVGLTSWEFPEPPTPPRPRHPTYGIRVRGEGSLRLNLVEVEIVRTLIGIECVFSDKISVEIGIYRARVAANGTGFTCDAPKEARVQIRDSVFSGNIGGIIALGSGDARILVENTFFVGNSNGLALGGNVEAEIRRSWFLDNVWHGVYVKSQHLEVYESLFQGNWIGLRVEIGPQPQPWPTGVNPQEVTLESNTFARNSEGVAIQASRPALEQVVGELEGSQFEAWRNRFIRNEGCGFRVQDAELLVNYLDIEGEENEFSENGQDLCPELYPWPEGFRNP